MNTYDVVLLDEVKTALGIEGEDEDETLGRLISATTLELEARLGTQFVQRSLVEYHEGRRRRLYLQRTPIISVASIADPAGNTVPATDYVVRQRRWLEHFGYFNPAQNAAGQETDWTVTYTAGWFASTAAVAQDVRRAVIKAISDLRAQPEAGARAVRVGDLSVDYGHGEAGASAAVVSPAVDEAAASLHAYRGVLV